MRALTILIDQHGRRTVVRTPELPSEPPLPSVPPSSLLAGALLPRLLSLAFGQEARTLRRVEEPRH